MAAPRTTIFALSSGRPPAAIAVMRVSGPAARDAMVALAGRLPEPRQATLATLRDPTGLELDRALLLWFPGPGSATGEDLAELHLHGGRAVVAAVEQALAALPGLVPAQPGEFTRRSFENGHIDLLQAEALADLLEAETEAQRRHALAVAGGGISRELAGYRQALLSLSARAEALIEFGDDEGDVADDPDLLPDIRHLAEQLDARLRQPVADRLREGVRIVVAGPPNSGKSSLVNALARREAALVSATEGTTRDLIEVPLDLAGIPVLLIDSAGLRDTLDEVERMGIARAHDALATADVVLWLGPSENAPDGSAVIIVAGKCDLQQPVNGGIPVSAVTGAGLALLTEHMVDIIQRLVPVEMPGLTTASRANLAEAAACLTSAASLADVLLVAEILRQGVERLDHLLGYAATEDMLEDLFSRFCIGK